MRPIGWGDLERALGLRPPARLEGPLTSKAAVALMLRARPSGLELLFIHRAEHPQDPWSGQMAFPGGRSEKGDAGLERTAIRETAEEIGIDLARAGRPLGTLDETRVMTRMRALDLTVTPFVFRLAEAPEPVLSPEVTSVHWIPLDDLLGSGYRELMDYSHDGQRLLFPCFRVQGKTIWGLTYRMFSNLQSLVEESDSGDRSAPPRITLESPMLKAAPALAKDVAVDLAEDRPGRLAKAAEAIASGGLNLDGFAEVEGILHVLTSDPRTARFALEAVGLRVTAEREVVVIRLEDRPGVASALFGRLADARLNVHFTYIAAGNRVVIAADEPAKAVELLREFHQPS